METERILLRHWQESDAEVLFKYASDPDVGPRAGWPAHKTIEESLEVIRTYFNNDTTWAIVLKETNEPIGCMGYYTHESSNIPIGENDCEVGYWLGKPYWNKGICTEALKLMLLLQQREAVRKYLGRSFHRKSCIRKGHGEMRFFRHRNAEQMQPTRGWRQGYGQDI